MYNCCQQRKVQFSQSADALSMSLRLGESELSIVHVFNYWAWVEFCTIVHGIKALYCVIDVAVSLGVDKLALFKMLARLDCTPCKLQI